MSALANLRNRIDMRRLHSCVQGLQHLSLEENDSNTSSASAAGSAAGSAAAAGSGSAGPEERRRCIFYDLETSIVAGRGTTPRGFPFVVPSGVPKDACIAFPMKRGMRRNLIVEIGAVDVDKNGTRTAFHRFVDPRLDYLTLRETLAVTGQSVSATLRFWQKLFYEKNMIQLPDRDASLEQRLQQFDALFDQNQFMPAKIALSHFIAYVMGTDGATANPFLVAHNGASFDAPIIRAHLYRLKLPQFDKSWMVDSIPAARRAVPRLKSYSLGKLHKKLIGMPFQAHHATADALALMRVCHALANIEGVPLYRLWCKKNPPLTAIKGIGPKTSKALRDHGIYDVASLAELVRTHHECPLKPLRHAWRSLRRKYGRRQSVRQAESRRTSNHSTTVFTTVLRSKSV